MKGEGWFELFMLIIVLAFIGILIHGIFYNMIPEDNAKKDFCEDRGAVYEFNPEPEYYCIWPDETALEFVGDREKGYGFVNEIEGEIKNG